MQSAPVLSTNKDFPGSLTESRTLMAITSTY